DAGARDRADAGLPFGLAQRVAAVTRDVVAVVALLALVRAEVAIAAAIELAGGAPVARDGVPVVTLLASLREAVAAALERGRRGVRRRGRRGGRRHDRGTLTGRRLLLVDEALRVVEDRRDAAESEAVAIRADDEDDRRCVVRRVRQHEAREI